MLDLLALAVVILAAIYFIALGLASFFAPGLASRFLLGFAGTASAHFLELTIRMIVGGALVVRSKSMLLGDLFSAFGWLVLVTTLVLFLVPWRWHRRFAERAVPQALRFLRGMGVIAIALGALLLYAVAGGAG